MLAPASARAQEAIAFLRDYAQHRLNSRLADARRSIPPHVVLDFGRQGLLGMQTPTALAGLGLGHRDALHLYTQLGAIDLTLATFVGIHNNLGIAPLLQFGTPEAKQELLPLLASGRMLGGLAITERGAGSNPRAIKGTGALLPSGNWKLDAQKIWIGNGSWAGMLNVFVRGAGERMPIIGFAVRTDKPGVRAGREAMTMGMRSIVQTEINLSGVEVEPRYLLGSADADFLVAESSFRLARLGLAMGSIGASKRCAQLMLRYASRRSLFNGPLADYPSFGRAVLNVLYSVQVLERLCDLITEELDAGRPVADELYFVCKALGPEYVWSAADALVQSLGGRGYLESNEAPQLLRDARLFRIFEGPTETMRGHLGALWRGSDALRTLLTSTDDGKGIAAQLGAACDQLWALPRPQAMSLVQYQLARAAAIGEVVAAGVAWWLVATRAPAPAAAEWARLHFEDAVARGVRALTLRAELDLGREKQQLEQSIGDVVQTLAGEDWDFDALLAP